MKEEYIHLNLREFFKILNAKKWYFVYTSLFFCFLIFVYDKNQPTEYVCKTKILPEVNHKAPNGLAGLFDAAKSISSGKELYNLEITPPSLYTDILWSTDFYNFLKEKNKNISFTKKDLEQRITISSPKLKAHVLLTKAQTKDEALFLNQAALSFLLKTIHDYRTQKDTHDLQFLESLKLNNNEEKEHMIIQQKLIIQDHTPYFKILNRNEISELPRNLPIKYGIGVLLSIFLVLNYILILNKNYLKIIERT